ncbi:cytochrome c553 [Sinobacterium caligoides]|uniref:Cytochrome c553 n=1 Tax=Sinobacterium caligoides TaxID=933926 RepID=A0A3N2DHT2_9GAMM|nr:c-type cytochrome [Sinobacterium caligoides]ROR98954.1 cytochrome c553 [Sinobacterium caligoides]
MKKVIAIALMTLGATSFANAAGDAAAGKAQTAACSACHGADGNSAMGMYPKLAGQGARYLEKQMHDIKSGVRPVPMMMGQLDAKSEQDIADIAAYFASQQVTVNKAKKDDLELGEQLFQSGSLEKGMAACKACHSPTGKGNAPAGFPHLGGQHAEYIEKQLIAFRTGYDDAKNPAARVNDGDTMIMRGVAGKLSDREIKAVANYISGLH